MLNERSKTMAEQLTPIKGDEFIVKLLNGERSFQNVKLEEGFDFNSHDGFAEMLDYLRTADLKLSPVRLVNSDFSHCIAKNLYLPYVRAQGADFIGADFLGSIFDGADFFWAKFDNADLRVSDIVGVDLIKGSLYEADLRGSNLSRSDFHGTNLEGAKFRLAELCDMRDFEYAINLKKAHFSGAIVTDRERAIIRKSLGFRKYFTRLELKNKVI